MLRPHEAVAIVQQLIHNIANAPEAGPDAGIDEPFGPPSLQNVYLDDEGFVTCQACQVTPAVAEVAIFLQQLLPEGTPKVPGALRYAIARALHDVDAPPFDSIHDFSAALERFETGDRTAVVRAFVGRATAVSLDRLRARTGEDRRRLMPSSTDFRRELRAADARYYELASAAGHVVLAAPKPLPDQRRSPTVAAGILAGICLVFVGEVMHTRSTTAPVAPAVAPAVQQAQEVPVAEPEPVSEPEPTILQDEEEPAPTRGVKVVKIVAPVATASLGADQPSKPAVKRATRRPSAAPASRPPRVKNGPGVMDRLHLGWLRSAFTVRHDPL